MSPDNLIARAEAALEGVTEGPWGCDDSGDVYTKAIIERHAELEMDLYRSIGSTRFHTESNADATFIAASRQLVPELIEALKKAETDRALVESDPKYGRLALTAERDRLAARVAELEAWEKRFEEQTIAEVGERLYREEQKRGGVP